METKDLISTITGHDVLIARFREWPTHPSAAICPECGGNCKSNRIIELFFTFEPCSCGNPSYTHLVEQLHHKDCYINAKGKELTETTA